MSQGNDIDPQLQDIVQKSVSGQEDTSHVSPRSPSIQVPPTSHSSLQVQPSHHPQHYVSYAPNSSGPFTDAYYGPSSGQQYGQSESAGAFHAFPTAPAVSHPGQQHISKAGADSKRLRACEACRGLKVRCEPDQNYGPCKRCLKSGRKCEITAPSRKRQKKTDSRVSELENELADLKARLRISGHIANDGEGQSYGGHISALEESPDRRPITGPFYSQSRNGPTSKELGSQLVFGDSQSDSQDHPRSAMDRNGPLEGPILSSQRLLPKTASPSSISSQEAIVTDIRMIARSVDTRLAMSLMSEYVMSMLPQKPMIGAILVDRVAFLQRSKPVLFIAVMMAMLQNWRTDTPKPKDLTKQSEGSEKGNQGLHLLSEVATGNSGPNDDEKKEKHAWSGEETRAKSGQDLANVLVKRLLDTVDEDAKTEAWFEELMQGFH